MQQREPRNLAGEYCVIGAGAAGLGAAEVFARHGSSVDVFEKTDRVGGHWHTDYESLHLITSRDSSGFPGHPMPASYPYFPSRDQVRDYLIDFAHANRLNELIHFNTEITSLTREPSGRWAVTTADGTTRRYDGVIVANGHLWAPKLPDIAAQFRGRSLHSSEFHNLDDVQGRRVLVVGAGNSGCDLAVEAAQGRLETTISMRRGQAFLPKTIFGIPRAELARINSLPQRLRDRVLRGLVHVVLGATDRYEGLPAPEAASLDDQPPVVNNLLLYWIQHGRISVAPGISEINGSKVTFTDGRTEEFDTILWATGFEVRVPFLPAEDLDWQAGVPGRLGGLCVPAPTSTTGADGLYFVGLAAPRGPQWPVYTRQTELIHRLLALREHGMTDIATRLDAIQQRDYRIDIVRSIWEGQMSSTERLVERWELSNETVRTRIAGAVKRARKVGQ